MQPVDEGDLEDHVRGVGDHEDPQRRPKVPQSPKASLAREGQQLGRQPEGDDAQVQLGLVVDARAAAEDAEQRAARREHHEHRSRPGRQPQPQGLRHDRASLALVPGTQAGDLRRRPLGEEVSELDHRGKQRPRERERRERQHPEVAG